MFATCCWWSWCFCMKEIKLSSQQDSTFLWPLINHLLYFLSLFLASLPFVFFSPCKFHPLFLSLFQIVTNKSITQKSPTKVLHPCCVSWYIWWFSSLQSFWNLTGLNSEGLIPHQKVVLWHHQTLSPSKKQITSRMLCFDTYSLWMQPCCLASCSWTADEARHSLNRKTMLEPSVNIDGG